MNLTMSFLIQKSEKDESRKHYEKGEKAKQIALKHLERRASAHGEDETLPIAVDENATAGRVISGETDDMLMKYKEMMQQELLLK